MPRTWWPSTSSASWLSCKCMRFVLHWVRRRASMCGTRLCAATTARPLPGGRPGFQTQRPCLHSGQCRRDAYASKQHELAAALDKQAEHLRQVCAAVAVATHHKKIRSEGGVLGQLFTLASYLSTALVRPLLPSTPSGSAHLPTAPPPLAPTNCS